MNNFLKAFSNPFVERVKSPLIGPFIVSWSLFNWKVIYTTIFISNETLFPLNKLEFILNEMNNCSGFIFPFSFTLAYIFLMPFVDRMLLQYTEEQKNRNLDLKLEIAKKHTVDGEKYFSLKDEFQKQKSKMLEYEKENKEGKEELQRRNDEISNLNNKIKMHNLMLEQLQKLRTRHDAKPILDGRWTSYVDGVFTDDIEFQDSKYFIIKKDNTQNHVFDLVGIDLDLERKRLTFTKFNIKSQEAVCFNELNIIDENTLEGTENRKLKIRYERRKLNS